MCFDLESLQNQLDLERWTEEINKIAIPAAKNIINRDDQYECLFFSSGLPLD